MTSSRGCTAWIPRTGAVVCVFVLGVMLGSYFLQHGITTPSLDTFQTQHPHFRCVEISADNREENGNTEDSKPDKTLPISSIKNPSQPGFLHQDNLLKITRNSSSLADQDLLTPGLVSNVAHYLWCEKKVFEFQHYLSVLSVFTRVRAERMVFHFGHYPRHDNQLYNTWFEDMKMEFPFIELHQVSSDEVCQSLETQTNFIRTVLREKGGIYVHFNTIFLAFPLELRKSNSTDALVNGLEGFLVLQKNQDPLTVNGTEMTKCSSPQDYRRGSSVCVIKKGPFRPRDAWDKSDDFSQEVNLLLYGSRDRPRAQPSDTLVPNIGHMVWLDMEEMPFLLYLSCLSHLYVLKVDRLYIHGNKQPTGTFWDKLKQEPNVTFLSRDKPAVVFRQKVGLLNHLADILRVDIMRTHGGFFTDIDAIWINPVPRDLLRYDVTASYDWPQMYSLYPDYIQIGVVMSKPGAKFWDYFMESFQVFKDDMYGYNGLLRAYKFLERHPELVHIEDRLQVMCWELRCHPTWYPDFRGKDKDHNSYSDFDWRHAYSFHWTTPTPDELLSEEACRASDTMFAQIGKHVLSAAGKY